jgi:hypothetical protein
MENQPLTTVQAQQQKANLLKREICLLLNWMEMEYAEYQYRNGLAYLMCYLPCDAESRYKLERSKMYWSWFKNHWMLYDESLLTYRTSLRQCPVENLLDVYDELHCPKALAVDVKINRVILESIKNTVTI